MDQKDRNELLKAARADDLLSLEILLHGDPKLLDKSDLLITPQDTPLHVATLSGNTKFAKSVLRRTPCLAWNQNQAGLSPLHIASALGHLAIARALLELGPELCLLRDQKGLTPLHHAAIKGRVEIISELLSKCPKVLLTVTSEDDSAFHLAVRHRQEEALAVLLRSLRGSGEMNWMRYIHPNKYGFTVFELAESTGQDKALALLKGRDGTPNTEQGYTPLGNEQEAMEIVRVDQDVQPNISGTDHKMSVGTQSREEQQQQRQSKIRTFSLSIARFFFLFGFDESLLQVVAVLLLQVTYQGLLSPPSSIWKQDMKLNYKCFKYAFSKTKNVHSPVVSCPTLSFILFMASNTVGFLSALLLLLQHKRGPRAAILLTISLYMLLLSYIVVLETVIPDYLAYAVMWAFTTPFLVPVMWAFTAPFLVPCVRSFVAPSVKKFWYNLTSRSIWVFKCITSRNAPSHVPLFRLRDNL